MTALEKCKVIAQVCKMYGIKGTLESYNYWGVELLQRRGRFYIILPFVLNVSFGVRSVKFIVGNETVLGILYKSLARISDK